MPNRNILIFIKAPVPGFVKTRLSPVVSPAQAAALYKAMAQDTLKAAQQVADAHLVLAYQGHLDLSVPTWLDMDSPVEWFAQEGEGLGERLIHATQTVFDKHPGPVVVIGSDCPGLTPAILDEAFQLLRSSPIVLGPSEDGGYYLFGLNKPLPAIFQGMRWSEPTLMDHTIAKLQQLKVNYKCLPRHTDLDTADDLNLLRREPDRVALGFHNTQAMLRQL